MAAEQPVEFHPEALAELERAKAWYSTQRLALASPSFKKSPPPSPESEKPRTPGRNISEERVIYGQRSTGLLVVAVMHLKRRPGYWKRATLSGATRLGAVKPMGSSLGILYIASISRRKSTSLEPALL